MAEREPNGPKRNTLHAMDAHFVLAGGDIAMMRAAMRQWLSSPSGEEKHHD